MKTSYVFLILVLCHITPLCAQTPVVDPGFVSPVSQPVSALAADNLGQLYVATQANAYDPDTLPPVSTPATLIRLHPNGTIDQSFSVGTNAPTWYVRKIILRHGRVYVLSDSLYVYDETGGLYRTYSGDSISRARDFAVDELGGVVYVTGNWGPYDVRNVKSYPNIFRIMENGQPDPSFSVDIKPDGSIPSFAGNYGLFAVSTQQMPEGEKLLVGGMFEAVNGTNAHHLTRLDLTGRVDPSFVTNQASAYRVRALHTDSQQRIYAVGKLGMPRLGLNGEADAGFQNPNCYLGEWTDSSGHWDARFLAAPEASGYITTSGSARPDLYACPVSRLDAFGEPDARFHFEVPMGTVKALAATTSGALYLGGSFTEVNGRSQPFLARMVPSPELTIARQGNSAVVLSWPAVFSNATLQAMASFGGGTWTPVSNSPFTTNGRLFVTNSLLEGPGFFRLATP